MRLSWVSTALALAATASAGVLRDVSPSTKLAVRDTEVTTTSVTTEVVVQYFQQTTTYFDQCHNKLATITEVAEAVTVITTTITTIQDYPDWTSCGCHDLTSHESVIVAVYTSFEAILTYVQTTYADEVDSFSGCWSSVKTIFTAYLQFTQSLGIDLSAQLNASLKINIFVLLGIDVDILGIHLSLGISIGGGGGGIGIGIGA